MDSLKLGDVIRSRGLLYLLILEARYFNIKDWHAAENLQMIDIQAVNDRGHIERWMISVESLKTWEIIR